MKAMKAAEPKAIKAKKEKASMKRRGAQAAAEAPTAMKKAAMKVMKVTPNKKML